MVFSPTFGVHFTKRGRSGTEAPSGRADDDLAADSSGEELADFSEERHYEAAGCRPAESGRVARKGVEEDLCGARGVED